MSDDVLRRATAGGLTFFAPSKRKFLHGEPNLKRRSQRLEFVDAFWIEKYRKTKIFAARKISLLKQFVGGGGGERAASPKSLFGVLLPSNQLSLALPLADSAPQKELRR